MQRNTGYFPTESLEPCGNRLFSRSALNEGYLFRGSLKELESDRLIIRREYPQIPPKVEYSLSDRGKSLMAVLDQLCIWGEKNKLG